MKYIYEDRILHLLFNRPMFKFHIRKLSKETGLDTKTVMGYLRKFIKEDIVIRKKERDHHPYYEANRLSRIYRCKKSNFMIENITKSGLIEYLEEKIHPELIILFGSMQKGTYYRGSDIDLFIKADKIKIDLSKFEKKLGHKINLFFEKDFKKLSKGLLQNIYNGHVFSGNIEVS